MCNIFRNGRPTKLTCNPDGARIPRTSAIRHLRSEVKVSRSRGLSDSCWTIIREWKVPETPKWVRRLPTPCTTSCMAAGCGRYGTFPPACKNPTSQAFLAGRGSIGVPILKFVGLNSRYQLPSTVSEVWVLACTRAGAYRVDRNQLPYNLLLFVTVDIGFSLQIRTTGCYLLGYLRQQVASDPGMDTGSSFPFLQHGSYCIFIH